MKDNQLKNTVVWALALLALLLAMHGLPGIRIGEHTMRRVDVLADIRRQHAEVTEVDTLPFEAVTKPPFSDTCRTGLTCIEDYADDTRRGMQPYYQALDELARSSRPVRIAVFGDSFIEADIMTADLRELLQKRYGGCGVGFVPMTSATNYFRPTVRHSFGGWESHSVVDSSRFDGNRQGVSGHYFIPLKGAYAELRGQKKYATLLDTCKRASIFFHNKGEVKLTARLNERETEHYDCEPNGHLQKIELKATIGSVRWMVERADSTVFYGMALDGNGGVSVDNFSLRGSSGLSLRTIPARMMNDFNRLRPYDLIVLQYGLNVATARGKNYDKYGKGMDEVLKYLKQSFPQAGILLVSVSDRGYKTEEGTVRTMPGVKNLLRYQQRLAADNAIAFWNLFEAMGGDGAMERLVNAQPPMANHDYTHINFRGGKHLAGLLYEALLYGKEQYDRRRAYEEE